MTQVEAIVLAVATLVVGALGVYVMLKAAQSQPPSTIINHNYFTVTTPQWPSESPRDEPLPPPPPSKSTLSSPTSSFAKE
jgi:hypothetical protein